MHKYNLSRNQPFEVLNIVGLLGDSPKRILVFGSYEHEEKIGDTKIDADSFYGDGIISERGIWSAVACFSGYRNRNRKFQDYGVIMQTLPISTNMECYMEHQVETRGPYYLCNELMSDLVIAVTPWKMIKNALQGLALGKTSNFLDRGQRSAHVGGDCDKGAHYYHARSLDIKMVRDFTSGREYTDWNELNNASHNMWYGD